MFILINYLLSATFKSENCFMHHNEMNWKKDGNKSITLQHAYLNVYQKCKIYQISNIWTKTKKDVLIILQEDVKGLHSEFSNVCNVCLYIGQTVPQVLVVCISEAVFAEVSYDPPLEHIICQKVSQHVQDTRSLVGEREKLHFINGLLQGVP